MPDNPMPSYELVCNAQRTFFGAGHTFPYAFRKAQLKNLKRAVKEYEADIEKAIFADFGKPYMETYVTETGFLYAEIDAALDNLKSWMRTERVQTPLVLWPSQSKIISQPKGVTLIIGPWNYPFQLLLAPLVAAIAAGNTAVLKPSELTPHTAQVVEDIISQTFDREYITVIQGAGTEVLPPLITNFRFDHIFFTGSVSVGRKIAEMAASQLSPVTLELGGKSPGIVDASADIAVAARRIAFGKWINAGQTCVAPDYILVHRSVEKAFMEALKKNINAFYGPDPLTNDEGYTGIINKKRFETLKSYLKQGTVIFGGKTDEDTLRMEPTLLTDVYLDSPVMQEEIFGPVLPVLVFNNIAEARQIILKNPNPLALYVFTGDKAVERSFTQELSFGGGAINNTVMHLGNPHLPFGGIGNSGFGNYHGKAGFDTFSHQKSVMKTSTWPDPSFKYPPYKGFAGKLVRWLLR